MVVRQARAASRLPVALVCAVLSLQTPVLAADSKWTLENFLEAKDIELSSENDSIRKVNEATLDRLLAEMFLRSDSDGSVAMSRSALKTFKNVLAPDDPRIQSVRYLLAEAVLKRDRISESCSELKMVLQQELDRDEQQEAKYRKKLSVAERREEGVETERQFKERYETLTFWTLYDVPYALVYRARLLSLDGRFNDSNRLLRMALSISKNKNQPAYVPKRSNYLIPPHLVPPPGRAPVNVEVLYQKCLNEWEANALAPNDRAMMDLEAYNNSLLNSPFVHKKDVLRWQARKLILDGIKAQAAGNIDEALKCFGRAEESSRKGGDRFEELIAQYYNGLCMSASGTPATAFGELNRVYEAARRSIEGRSNGLFYRGLGLASLRAMTDCIMARIDRVRDTEYGAPLLTVNGEFKCNVFEWEEIADLQKYLDRLPNSSRGQSQSKFEELANDLYHTAYQYKSTGRQKQARILFWNAIAIYDKYLPTKQRLLSNALYDLAESYMWGEDYDAAIPIFTRCVEIRRELDPNSTEYVMTLSTLGRAYMSAGKSKEAVICLKKALHGLIHKEKLQTNKVLDLAARIRNSRTESRGTEGGAEYYSEQLSLMPLHAQLDTVAVNRRKSDPDSVPQIDDLWQVLADAYSRGKYFDEAQEVSKGLLDLRKSDRGSSKDTVLDSLWQLAYIYSVSYKTEEARNLFSEMVREHAKEPGRPLADWLYTLGILEDSLGKPKEARKAFSTAIVQYKKEIANLDPVKDKEQVQNIGWTIDDLKYELRAKQRCPEISSDYMNAYPTNFWSKSRFPLKIYIDDSRDHGFGSVLHKRFEEAVNQWITTPGLNVSFKFVDDKEDADIYLERVSTYDQIPVGSGGGAVATFVQKGNHPTREIDRVHLRIYCAKHDADGLSNYAVEHLYTLALHEFGHALGLGHSPSGLDVMYWKSAIRSLSKRDRATLLKVYGCKGQNPG